jgi:hypothetical protein
VRNGKELDAVAPDRADTAWPKYSYDSDPYYYIEEVELDGWKEKVMRQYSVNTIKAVKDLVRAAYQLNADEEFNGTACKMVFDALNQIDPEFGWGNFLNGEECYLAWRY